MAFLAATLVVAGCASKPDTDDDNAFWSALRFTSAEVEQYESVSAMAASADLVVLGTIEEIGVGRTWGSQDPTDRLTTLALQVKIDGVLRGKPIDGVVDVVSVEREVMSLASDALGASVSNEGLTLNDGVVAAIPNGKAVWFLRLRDDEGTELVAAEVQFAGGRSYRLVNSMGLVTEAEGGSATTPVAEVTHFHDRAAELPEEWLFADITDLGFAQVVDAARVP
ncbi:MAG: hypothetical protein ABFR89_12840 [Actinomycetota bacterium]